ncbi:hypothetical protein L596_004500 [Steinernema carpocapsae]|uniref:Uncharacterized protein n=1 Tax=Steinernema carpocapsae TaxID=34508 RepID=A0A4U8UW03_STECR|nr:hypothetical protein L596_004500 [Steinernema carpocapsae]
MWEPANSLVSAVPSQILACMTSVKMVIILRRKVKGTVETLFTTGSQPSFSRRTSIKISNLPPTSGTQNKMPKRLKTKQGETLEDTWDTVDYLHMPLISVFGRA